LFVRHTVHTQPSSRASQISAVRGVVELVDEVLCVLILDEYSFTVFLHDSVVYAIVPVAVHFKIVLQ
jgi:hypothetical protein